MTTDYKALAAEVREMRLGHKVFGGTLEILETLLEGMAEAEPIYAYEWDAYDGAVRRSFSPAPYNGVAPHRTLLLYPCQVVVMAHPAPQPQGEPTAETLLRDLLAFIHRDGGHYVEEYGVETAVTEAIHVISTRNASEPTEAQIDYRALYHDLLFAVGNKHAGETRHETALRYIREAERSDGAALAAREPK